MKLLLILIFSPLIFFAQGLPGDIRYLALGDSYTIGASVVEEKRWPNQFIDSLQNLGYNIEKNDIIATSGWTTTSLLAAMDAAELENDYNLISILIGVNNFYQGRPIELYLEELPEIIDSALVLANQDTNALFMVTIPDYGYTPFGEVRKEVISMDTDLYNGIKDSIGNVYGIPLYNITEISRNGLDDPELVAIDGLHPSAKQYAIWVDLIINQMLTTETVNTSNITENSSFELIQNGSNFNLVSEVGGIINVFDIKGALVYEEILKKGEAIFFNIPKGLFVMNFTGKNVSKSLKVIVK